MMAGNNDGICSCENNNRISGNTNHILPQSMTYQTGYGFKIK